MSDESNVAKNFNSISEDIKNNRKIAKPIKVKNKVTTLIYIHC